ncbi:MAG: alpha/beta hydrolase [Vicinamibacterales bacterium]|nr:alpha/beta hydrolase [Vicinamibacterales bacterium]
MRRVARWIALGLVAAGVGVTALYLRDMNRAYARIGGTSTAIPSPFGAIEYAEGGAGLPVLVVHGSGGGFDQGTLLAGAVLGDGFRWIAPSRFGYLGSARPDGATFDDQADAYAHLLDHLDLDRVAVVALSHGAPSALLFAVRHPDRVASLTLISAGVAASTAGDQAAANEKGARLTTIFRYNPLYWAVTRMFRRQLVDLMGADAAVLATLTPGQRTLVDRVIDEMNPVAPRSAGVALDNTAAMPNERIAAIEAPTLVLHATDDGLQLFHNAEFAAATIPEVQLVRFDRGGHLLLAVEQPRIRALTEQHIRTSLQASP